MKQTARCEDSTEDNIKVVVPKEIEIIFHVKINIIIYVFFKNLRICFVAGSIHFQLEICFFERLNKQLRETTTCGVLI